MNQNRRATAFGDSSIYIGAPEGTRTHTLKAREPKSRMSTNSITGAYFVLDSLMEITFIMIHNQGGKVNGSNAGGEKFWRTDREWRYTICKT